jgi:hypothetical protein
MKRQILRRLGRSRTYRGFVQEKNLRVMNDPAHDVQCAPHSARERPDRPVALVRQAEQLEQTGRAFFDDFRRQVVEQTGEAQVFGYGQGAVERRLLKHQADRRTRLDGLAHDIVSMHAGAAAGWANQRGQHVNRGGFAGAIRTEEAEELPCRNFEIEPVDGEDVTVTLDESAGLHGQRTDGRRIHGP